MDEKERILIISELKIVDNTILSVDFDRTVSMTLKYINQKFSKTHELYFANGGDQNNTSIPEIKICEKLGIKLIDGLGDKIQSSSWILSE
jgi:glycerol-3-phosphate cytidylyltransferase-like family protein